MHCRLIEVALRGDDLSLATSQLPSLQSDEASLLGTLACAGHAIRKESPESASDLLSRLPSDNALVRNFRFLLNVQHPGLDTDDPLTLINDVPATLWRIQMLMMFASGRESAYWQDALKSFYKLPYGEDHLKAAVRMFDGAYDWAAREVEANLLWALANS